MNTWRHGVKLECLEWRRQSFLMVRNWDVVGRYKWNKDRGCVEFMEPSCGH